MPRMIAPPYSNHHLLTHTDAVRKRRAHVANNAVLKSRLNQSIPVETLASTGISIATSPRDKNFGAKHQLTPIERR